jgi:hypothetical protein
VTATDQKNDLQQILFSTSLEGRLVLVRLAEIAAFVPDPERTTFKSRSGLNTYCANKPFDNDLKDKIRQADEIARTEANGNERSWAAKPAVMEEGLLPRVASGFD